MGLSEQELAEIEKRWSPEDKHYQRSQSTRSMRLEYWDDISSAIAEIRRLREKLAWYGDRNNHKNEEVRIDNGQRAREALGK